MPGIKVEEVSGGDLSLGPVWIEMARQIYCENGREAYREIGHFRNGAPFLHGENTRISMTHCRGLLAVATLPPTPEVDLAVFSERACLGIDAERADRRQVIDVREKFLSADELAMIPADDVEANVIAWTVKEAVYKALLYEGLDFRRDIHITRMPKPAPPTPLLEYPGSPVPKGAATLPPEFLGTVTAKRDAEDILLTAYTYRSDDCLVTIVYSPRSAKFGKNC